MSRIKELYYDYTQNPEYAVQIPQEFEKSYKDFEKKLKEKVGEKFEDYSDLCDLYNASQEFHRSVQLRRMRQM